MESIIKDYDKEFQKTLRQFFKNKRSIEKISIDYLSRSIGVLPSTYARYENGIRNMPLSVMKCLCIYYHLDYYETFKLIDSSIKDTNSEKYIEPKVIETKKIAYTSSDLLERIERLEKIIMEKNNIK